MDLWIWCPLVDLLNVAMTTATRLTQVNDMLSLQAVSDKKFVLGNYFLAASVLWSASDVLQLPRMSPCFADCLNQGTTGWRSLLQSSLSSRAESYLLTYLLIPFWEANQYTLQLVKKFPAFMEPESPSPYPQVSATCPYPEPTPSSPHDPFQLPEDPS